MDRIIRSVLVDFTFNLVPSGPGPPTSSPPHSNTLVPGLPSTTSSSTHCQPTCCQPSLVVSISPRPAMTEQAGTTT